MRQKGRRLTDKNLLTALACGATIESAARTAGVSAATAYRRLRDPEFTKDLQTIRADLVQRTAGTLTAAALEAVKTLLSLQSSSIPPAVRLGAAKAILEYGLKVRETTELTDRITALEAQLVMKAS